MYRRAANIEELVHKAFNKLDRRSVKILTGRYGLGGDEPKTLADLGRVCGITRERVRQIEAYAIAAVKEELKRDRELKYLVEFLHDYLEQVGNLRRDDFLTQDLYHMWGRTGSLKEFANALRFLADIIDSPQLVEGDENWHDVWLRDYGTYHTAQKIVAALLSSRDHDFDLFLKALVKKYDMPEPLILNYLSVSKRFMVGPFGDLGADHWVHVNPRTVRDKSYLVLVRSDKPLHFSEVAKQVNSLGGKPVHHQSVHNELIRDPRFVWIGRGMYAVKEHTKK
jgi:hypothetical protein